VPFLESEDLAPVKGGADLLLAAASQVLGLLVLVLGFFLLGFYFVFFPPAVALRALGLVFVSYHTTFPPLRYIHVVPCPKFLSGLSENPGWGLVVGILSLKSAPFPIHSRPYFFPARLSSLLPTATSRSSFLTWFILGIIVISVTIGSAYSRCFLAVVCIEV